MLGRHQMLDGRATHFLCTTLPKVATEMALDVLACNMKRVMNIMGVDKLLEAMRALMAKARSIFARVGLLLDDLRTSQAAIWADRVAFSREMSLDRAVRVN